MTSFSLELKNNFSHNNDGVLEEQCSCIRNEGKVIKRKYVYVENNKKLVEVLNRSEKNYD